MWIVANIKPKEINVFKEEFKKKLGSEVKFYYPKILYKKYLNNTFVNREKPILDNYLFCLSSLFSDKKNLNDLKYCKGLNYFLNNFSLDQKDILRFIKNCKDFEDEKGFLLPSFLNNILQKKGQFTSGPFNNLIFEIIEKHKKNLKIKIGNFITTVNCNKYLFKPI